MIVAVILASGMSKRFGQNKLLMPLGKQRIVEYVIDSVQLSHIENIFLVYGHHEEEFKEIAQRKKINSIYNPEYCLGQSMSVKRAIETVGDHAEGIMFFLGDQPFVSPDTINILIHHFEQHPEGIIVPTYEEKRGNPVIFSRDFFEEMRNLQGDQGARNIIKNYFHRVIHVPISHPMENYDIDTKDDYEEAIKYRRGLDEGI